MGRWGQRVALAVSSDPRCSLVALCDTSPSRLLDCRSSSEAAAFSDIDDMMRLVALDAVVLCTPAATHFALARLCLASGKHVFVEKPLALSQNEGQELVTLAQARGRRLFVGHVYLYHPAVSALTTLIIEGALGRLNKIESIRLNAGPVRDDVDVIWDLAPHDLALLQQWIAGAPSEVRVATIHRGRASVHLGYQTGTRARLLYSWSHQERIRRARVTGSLATALFEETVSGARLLVGRDGSWRELPVAFAGSPLEREWRAFLDWIHDDKVPPSEAAASLPVLATLDRIAAARAQGGISTPPAGAFPRSKSRHIPRDASSFARSEP